MIMTSSRSLENILNLNKVPMLEAGTDYEGRSYYFIEQDLFMVKGKERWENLFESYFILNPKNSYNHTDKDEIECFEIKPLPTGTRNSHKVPTIYVYPEVRIITMKVPVSNAERVMEIAQRADGEESCWDTKFDFEVLSEESNKNPDASKLRELMYSIDDLTERIELDAYQKRLGEKK